MVVVYDRRLTTISRVLQDSMNLQPPCGCNWNEARTRSPYLEAPSYTGTTTDVILVILPTAYASSDI